MDIDKLILRYKYFPSNASLKLIIEKIGIKNHIKSKWNFSDKVCTEVISTVINKQISNYKSNRHENISEFLFRQADIYCKEKEYQIHSELKKYLLSL